MATAASATQERRKQLLSHSSRNATEQTQSHEMYQRGRGVRGRPHSDQELWY